MPLLVCLIFFHLFICFCFVFNFGDEGFQCYSVASLISNALKRLLGTYFSRPNNVGVICRIWNFYAKNMEIIARNHKPVSNARKKH